MTTDQANEQADVTRWFDETYRAKGLEYLRPLQAYPIYLQLLDARPGHKLLDVGCGPGLLLKAAGMTEWFDERAAVLESLTGFKRAGADGILSYFSGSVAAWLAE